MATLQLHHPALIAAVRSRPDIREALAEDPHLVQHVLHLDMFLQALTAEWPGRELAERLCARILPSRQDVIAVRKQRGEAITALERTPLDQDRVAVLHPVADQPSTTP